MSDAGQRFVLFFFQAEDGIRDGRVTGVQTCALPISDDGVALGAALAPYLDQSGRLPNRAMRHAYLGPEFGDDAIESVLKTYKLRYIALYGTPPLCATYGARAAPGDAA